MGRAGLTVSYQIAHSDACFVTALFVQPDPPLSAAYHRRTTAGSAPSYSERSRPVWTVLSWPADEHRAVKRMHSGSSAEALAGM
eukprot:352785-Chlamydomonas_euryale.AAC.5